MLGTGNIEVNKGDTSLFSWNLPSCEGNRQTASESKTD